MPSKTGYVVRVNRQDCTAVVKEDGTMTEFLVFLDELSDEVVRELRVYSSVSFTRHPGFEQFVVENLELKHPDFRKVI